MPHWITGRGLFYAWALGLAIIVTPWVVLNFERDPSVQSGVTFGAGLVAYVLMGATVALVYVAHSELAALLSAAREAEISRLTQVEKMEEARMDGLLPFFELVAVDARMRELKVKNVCVGPAGQGLVKIWISQSDGRAPVPGSTDLQDLDGRLRFLAETGEPHFTASFGPIAAGETKSEPFFEAAGFNDTLQHLVGVPVDAYFVINYEDVFHRPFHVAASRFSLVWNPRPSP